MINKISYKEAQWVDLNNPDQEEIKSVAEEYGIEDPVVSHELTSPSIKPRVELHKKYIYLIIHFPVFKHTHLKDTNVQEIDFLINKNSVITTRYDTIDALHKFSKIMEVDSILNKEGEETGVDFIFFGILKEAYQSLIEELDYVEDWLDDIEKKVYTGDEKEMVIALSNVARVLLDFKKTIDTHQELLEALEVAGKKLFGDKFSHYTKIIMSEYLRAQRQIKSHMEQVAELRETNNSLLSTKQNEEMKFLTVIAMIALPLSIITSLFQVDTIARPLIGTRYDFWILIGILAIVGLSVWSVFKYKKWI